MKLEGYSELNSKVHGVTSYDPDSGKSRQQIIYKYAHVGVHLIPERDPDNEVDPNAVKLWLQQGRRRYHIGYLSEPRAKLIAPRLDNGERVDILIKQLTGGTRDRPTRGVNIVIRYDFINQPKQPAPLLTESVPASPRKKLPALKILVILIAVLIGVAILCALCGIVQSLFQSSVPFVV